ncbi:MAG: fumarylacetoacetate hydrolase family protein, partial [Hyphomicrobium sp.]|nr:fumarylacetoacetate hydrolase family protein [Hyphomicrobium sp.]
MKLRRVEKHGGATRVELLAPQGWVPAAAAAARISSFNQGIADDVVTLLALPLPERERLTEAARDVAPVGDGARPILPFAPRSFRDFMLYERHAVDAARGFVRRFMPMSAA